MKVLNDEKLSDVVKDGVWIVDFYADWCGPCKMLMPVLEEMNYENIIKVNVDIHPDISASFGIMSIPTLLFFKSGEEVDKIIGFTDEKTIKEKIENLNKN